MNKLKRTIHPLQYQESEKRIVHTVFEHIHHKEEHHSFRVGKPVYVLGSLLSVLIVLTILVVNSFTPTPDVHQNPTLSTFQNRKLAEIGYISGSIIAASQPVTTTSIFRMSDTPNTAFETNIDSINLYFDMLRVFLEDDPFANSILVEDTTNSEFDSIITFTSNGYSYQFQLTYTTTNTISGILLFENQQFTVEGSIQETDTTFEVELIATALNNDYVQITYETESEDEVETEYFITSLLHGIETTREIKIEHENDESTVQIIENNNEFQLEKEFEDGSVVYELTYHIGDVEGFAKIIELIGPTGDITYRYQFEEGDHVEEFEHDRPDYDNEYENDQFETPVIPPILHIL